ncbi:hypothetical protein SNEBB_007398 [Seison nebaliae]|nr:hypothetical protein SNEBB_007398 [Seison nebaliae]
MSHQLIKEKLKLYRAQKISEESSIRQEENEEEKSSSSVEKSLKETKRLGKDTVAMDSDWVVYNGNEERTKTASDNQLLNVSVKERAKKRKAEETRERLNSSQFSLDSNGSDETNGSNGNVPNISQSNISPFPNNHKDGYEGKYNRLAARYSLLEREIAIKTEKDGRLLRDVTERHDNLNKKYQNYKTDCSNKNINMQNELSKLHTLNLQSERNISILTDENKKITLKFFELLKDKSDLMKKESDLIEEKTVLIENARQSEENIQRSNLIELEKMKKENLASIKNDDQIEKLLMKEREMKRSMENLKEEKRDLINENELLVDECHTIKRSLIDKDERLHNMQSFSDDLERKIGRQSEEKAILSLQLRNLQFDHQLLGEKCDKLSEEKRTKTIEIQTTIIDEQSKTIAIQTELKEKDNSQFLTSQSCQTMEISMRNDWTQTQIQMRDNCTETQIQMRDNWTEIEFPNKIPSVDTISSLIDRSPIIVDTSVINTRNPTVNITTDNSNLSTTLNRIISPKTVDGEVQTDDISVVSDESFIRLLSQTQISKDEVKVHTINEEKLSNSFTSSLKIKNVTEKKVEHIKELLPVKDLDVMKENNEGQVFKITRENMNNIESWIRRCSDLERQNLFLQMETETIGEYITKYHKMRQLLKVKYQSKDEELKIFRKELLKVQEIFIRFSDLFVKLRTEIVQSSPTIEEMSHVLEIHKRLEAESDSRYRYHNLMARTIGETEIYHCSQSQGKVECV